MIILFINVDSESEVKYLLAKHFSAQFVDDAV